MTYETESTRKSMFSLKKNDTMEHLLRRQKRAEQMVQSAKHLLCEQKGAVWSPESM